MAKQRGVLRLKGTLDGITFYKGKDGYMARTKGSIDRSRISSDPAFQRTRENNAEFGNAGKAGKLIRTAFRTALISAGDKRLASRLTKEMLRIVRTDTVNLRGQRIASAGDLLLIKQFDFNINAKWGTTFFAPYVPIVDRAAGSLSVSIAPFTPLDMVVAPSGTTHFKLLSGGAEIDFDNGLHVSAMSNSAVLPYSNAETELIELNSSVTAASVLPLLLVFGIAFFQEVNGQMYTLKNGVHNALNLVEIIPAP